MWYSWFFILEAVVIVTGNVTVLVVFTRTPALRKRKHFLLVSLAVADLLVGVISVPMYVTILYVGNIVIIYQIQDVLFATASMFGLTAVAIERAYAVYFPFKHRTLWKGVYMIGIAAIWIMAAFIAISSKIHFYGIIIETFILTAPIIFSLVVIIISYFLIWIKVNCMTNTQGRAIQRRDNKLTVTLLIVTVISLIAWIPFQAIVIYLRICTNCFLIGSAFYGVAYTCKLLHYGNSLVNPIIYALRMPQFKRAVFNVVRCCKQNQLTEQVPNERPEPNHANILTLANYVNNALTIDEIGSQGITVKDQTQLNNNLSTAHVSGRRDEDKDQDTSL